jgi:hypothetical protein
MAAYVSLIAESNGLVTTSSQISKDWLAVIREQGAALKDKNRLLEESAILQGRLKEALDAIELVDDRAESVKMKEQLGNLDTLYNEVMNNETLLADAKVSLWMEYADKRELLEKQITKTEEEEEKARIQASREKTIELLEIANNFATEYQNLMTNIATLAYQMIEDDAKIKTDKLDKQYEEGKISLEEYEDKKTEIEKKAAKDRYKVQMWEWTAQIATAYQTPLLVLRRHSRWDFLES